VAALSLSLSLSLSHQSTITTSCSKVLFQDDTNVRCRRHSTHPPLRR
jgi:hypothetical protein